MIRIGSRGSALARWQAEHIAARLRGLGQEVTITIFVTTGDRVQAAPFQQVGTKGMFTKEIEEALADDQIDLAVHSLKDLPTVLHPSFLLAAIPQRADARDAFVSTQYESLDHVPQGAILGTSSLRRQALVRSIRPDLDVRELRGNVDTRLRKLRERQYDAIVLAAAGLDRLQQIDSVRERFPAERMCPAPGQGALAIECRAEDEPTRTLLAALDHQPTHFAVIAERAALARLEGGCQVPIGVYCDAGSTGWKITGVVARPDGTRVLRDKVEFDADASDLTAAREAGRRIADRLLESGAAEMLGLPELAHPAENAPA
ncbi:MAG TPA: hydroxymethylbilane synthase [Acidobacteriaceae bacterium]|nr:hydroxymethylbilane synthase [Acidobacteriaceae bacterium]